jgi:hypothetical protein
VDDDGDLAEAGELGGAPAPFAAEEDEAGAVGGGLND